MATHEADLEYGPTPEDAEHEHTDIEPSIAWQFAIWLAVAMGISAAIVYGAFWFFKSHDDTANRAAQVFPLAAGQAKEPPTPRLQTQPFKDLYALRQNEQERLSNYAWVDKGTGTVRIPIEDAMKLVVDRGLLPARPNAPEDPALVPMDSSAGRTLAPR